MRPPGPRAGPLPWPRAEPEEEEDGPAPPGEPPIPDDVEGMLAEVASSDDPGRVRRIAGIAARELTPGELRRLYLAVEALPDPARVEAFRRHAPLYTRFLRREGPAFTSRRLSSHAKLFEAAGRPAAGKTLLVLFTNIIGGAFMSVVRLLMRLPEGAFDVLRLDVGPTGDYPGGVPGLGDNLFAVSVALRDIAAGHAGSAALGTSLGGFAALRAGMLARLPVAVSLGGRFTRIERLAQGHGAAEAWRIPAFDPLCPCRRLRWTRLIAYHSAENAWDTQQAAQLAAMRPEVRIRPGTGTPSHNLVPPMLASGAFDAMLQELWRLSLRPPPRGAARAPAGIAGPGPQLAGP